MQLSDIITSSQPNNRPQPETSPTPFASPASDLHYKVSGNYDDVNEEDRQRGSNISFCDAGLNGNIFYSQDQRASEGLCHACKTYLEEKRTYESAINNMDGQLDQKDHVISSLQQKVSQLKNQQQYLLKALQKLQQHSASSSIESEQKLQKWLKVKQEQLSFANKQISKLKQWLKEQKTQVFRSIECIKIKDLIIENLEKQLEEYKEREAAREKSRSRRKARKGEGSGVALGDGDQITKYKAKLREMQQLVQQLTEEIDVLRNANTSMKNTVLIGDGSHGKQESEQPQTPILKLKSFSNDKNVDPQPVASWQSNYNIGSGQQNAAYVFLTKKCLILEMEMEKLLGRMQQLKEENTRLTEYKSNRSILERTGASQGSSRLF